MGLQKLLLDSEEILLSEFKIKPEESYYKVYQDDEWKFFLNKIGAKPDVHGVYLPRDLSANVGGSSKYFKINLLHEYFGHGLFCEHALPGQKIVSLEKNLARIESKMQSEDGSLNQNHFQVDETNPYFVSYRKQREELEKFFYSNLHNYEGFAMWLEHFLSKNTNHEEMFEQKMDRLVHPDYEELFEKFLSFSEQYGNFALIAQLGFPKYYDDGTLANTLNNVFGDDFDSVELAILYGSQKPYSDIDLFVVSDKINSAYNSWLDIYARNRQEFKHDLRNLSIAVTDPIFSGRVIKGDPRYQAQLQHDILNQPISQKAIEYNYRKSKEQGRIALMYPEGSREKIAALSYEKSFRVNADRLQQGEKMLTVDS